ncbi:hypothetical protein [Rhodobaculum claviforme]|nr:hypothetical protein [Rhodobaculum claviforme]
MKQIGGRVAKPDHIGRRYADGLFVTVADLPETIDTLLNDPDMASPELAVFVKTHAGPSPQALEAVRDGRIRLLISHRHPADSALSLIDSSRKISEGTAVKTLDEVTHQIAWSDRMLRQWAEGGPNLMIDFVSMATRPYEVGARINAFLDLGLTPEQVHEEIDRLEADKTRYGKFNKGKVDRRNDEMSPDEIARLEQVAPYMTELYVANPL